MNKSYLIIPDPHHEIEKVEQILTKEEGNYEIMVCLGDEMDSWGDSPLIAEKTARWLKNSLLRPNRIHIFGNHLLPYVIHNYFFQTCPGYRGEKKVVVDKILKTLPNPPWSYFKVYHYLEEYNVLFSHAGFTKQLFGSDIHLTKQEWLDVFESESDKWLKASLCGDFHFFSEQGARMGSRFVAGPFWFDARYTKWEPIPGIKTQIVGHSWNNKFQMFRGKNDSRLFVLDAPGCYGLIRDNQLIIKSILVNGPKDKIYNL